MTDAWTDLSSAELAACHAWLLGLARRLADDDAQAEDLVQDAWAVAGRRGFGLVRDLRAFLAGVVRVRARRERAERHARTAREMRAAQGEALPSTDELAARLELARRVAEELAQLGAEQRELLLLCYQEGLAPTTIARRRGVPAGTVRSQLARARDALRARLDRRHAHEREAWAAVALAPLARGLAPAAAVGAWLGGVTMAGWKVAAGVTALVLLGWIAWPERRPLVPALPEHAARSDAELASARAPAQGAAGATRSAPLVAASAAVVQGDTPRAVRLRVVDRLTGAALPEYAVQCEREGLEPEIVVTDSRGEAELAARWFEAPSRLLALDDAEDPIDDEQSLALAPDMRPEAGAALELAVIAGPTYRLLFEEPRSVEELVVVLGAGNEPSDWTGSMGRVRAGAGGQLPWTRLDPGHANTTSLGEGPWTLTVRDERGHFFAWSAVTQVQGVQREPVVLAGGATGAIRLAVTVGGQPIESELGAAAYPLVDGQGVQAGSRSVLLHPGSLPGFPGRGGRALLGHLRPGPHVVWVGNTTLGSERRDVDVRAGETLAVEIDLPGRAELAPLDVVAKSQTGRTPLSGLTFIARRADGGDGQRMEVARWVGFEHDGAVTRYRFHALEPGEWRVELDVTPDLPPWRSRAELGRPGGAPLEFLCLDEGAPPRVTRRVRVVDARSGEPIPFAGVTCYIGHRRAMLHEAAPDGTLAIGPYMSGLEIELLARAEGFCPAWTRIVLAEDEEPVLELALAAGWGSLLDVYQPGPGPYGEPLPGVHVLLDGVAAGITDEHGQLLLSTAARPQKIALELAGYRIQYGDVDPATGAPQGGGQYPLWVLMERAP